MKLHIDIHASEVAYLQGQGYSNPAEPGAYNNHAPLNSVGMAMDNMFSKMQTMESSIMSLEAKIVTLESEHVLLETEFDEHRAKEDEITRTRNEAKWVDDLYIEAEVAAKLASNG